MKRFKRIAGISLALCICAGIATYTILNQEIKVVNCHGDHMIYTDAKDLANYADLILIGKPTKDFSEFTPYIKLNSAGRIDDYCTFVDIKPIKVIKGNVNGDIIKASQRAALIDKKDLLGTKELIKNEDVQILEKDKSYLLFLKDIGNGQYSIVSLNQGMFKLDDTPITDKVALAAAKADSDTAPVENKQYEDLKNQVLNNYSAEISATN